MLEEGGGVVFVRAPQRPGAFLLPGEVPPARPLLHPVERNTREIWVAGAEAPAPPDEKGTTVEGQAGKSALADHDTDIDEPPASMAVRHLVEVHEIGRVVGRRPGEDTTAHQVLTVFLVMVRRVQDVHGSTGAEAGNGHLERSRRELTATREVNPGTDEAAAGVQELKVHPLLGVGVGGEGHAVPQTRVRPRIAKQEPEASTMAERRTQIRTCEPNAALGPVEGQGAALPVELAGELTDLPDTASDIVDARHQRGNHPHPFPFYPGPRPTSLTPHRHRPS